MDQISALRDRHGTHTRVDGVAQGYVFRVYGTPAPQGSKRALGPGRMIENSKKVGPWREAVVTSILRIEQFVMMTGPVEFTGLFVLGRPKYHFDSKGDLRENAPREVIKPPDIDKLCRSTFDALTQSGLIKDDSLIWKHTASKVFCNVGEAPGAYIYVVER